MTFGVGIGSRAFTIDDYTNCSAKTVTATVDGVANVCTENDTPSSVQWDAVTDNATSATNLAVCLNTITGLSTSATAAVAYIQPGTDITSVSLDESDPTCTTRIQGPDGALKTAVVTRHIDLTMGASNTGPTAPGSICNGSVCGGGFDADAEQGSFEIDIPESWDGASDMTFVLNWTNQNGSAIPDTKQVIWDFDYRSIARSGETVSQGAAVAGTVTYTQSGAGTDGQYFQSLIILPWNTGNQPLTKDDLLIGILTRDLTGEGGNSYSGDALVFLIELRFPSDRIISTH